MFICSCSKEKLELKDSTKTQFEENDTSENISYDEDLENKKSVDEGADSSVHSDGEKISVFVCGRVKAPGVYELDKGSRIEDALTAAGGFSKGADRVYINRAEILEDGQKVYFPSKEETEGYDNVEDSSKESETKNQDEKEADGLININSASKEELMTLSGIGDAKATNIINYRENQGEFTNKEDIKNVDGIGEGVYEKIYQYITVGN